VIRFLVRRISLGVLVMLLVTMAVFTIFYVGPGGDSVARKLAGRAAPQSTVNLIKHRLGLDEPLWTQYWYFLWGHGSQHGLLQGDLGTDYYNGVSVNSEIKQELPISFWLIVGAAFLWLLMGTISGMISAVRPRSFADRTFTLIALFFYSIPTFVLGLLLLLVFFYFLTVHGLAIFPASGYVGLTENPWEWFRHLLLPWFTLAAVSAAVYTRLTRGAMLDVLGEDFIRTARSKGVSERRVIFLHAFRPASSPIISQFGIDFGSAVGAVIVIESIFGLPGLGYSVLNAVSTQDLPQIMGITIIGSAAVVLANILADILYAVVDPRVRLH
jgi:peptide/nickel transport system permease protein